jgi:hypothetical protein
MTSIHTQYTRSASTNINKDIACVSVMYEIIDTMRLIGQTNNVDLRVRLHNIYTDIATMIYNARNK